MHKVWILDCKSCRTFLTNRGMKAVLLLRPNVSLFSTDALPANCSAFSTCQSPNAPARAKPRHEPPRTCECLTQTLCCHGCGSPVGYMIVVPCMRCSSSVCVSPPLPAAFIHTPGLHQHTSRSASGHRFVFHSSEVLAEERLYVSGEPGVIPDFDPTPPPAPWHNSNFIFNTPHTPTLVYTAHIPLTPFAPRSPLWGHHANSSVDHAMNRTFNLPTPPPDVTHSTSTSITQSQPHRDPYTFDNTPSFLPISSAESAYFHIPNGSHFTSYSFPPQPQDDPGPEPEPEPAYRKPMLQPGNTLCWYHLARHGELPCVEDDPRARSGRSSTSEMQIHSVTSTSPSASTEIRSDTRPANIWCAR
ncbi:hypothetical protein BD410DRAFT_742892 [Rickenella mellea]|uniref:Uncharacterized protein n=1 Tax=Rickenella mellea TaxID=50990 RepID=A0A4Y7QHE1_9AGAM|nr:hypothetical protein BD410DRAFT_742892 [Rickenella mellea]